MKKAESSIDVINRIPSIEIDEPNIKSLLDNHIDGILVSRQDWLNKINEINKIWDNFFRPGRKGPWNNSADIHVPLTYQHVKVLHAFVFNAFFSVRPWFMIEPVEDLDVDNVKIVDELMRWALTNYINYNRGIESVMDDWIKDILVYGFGFVKVRWDKQETKAIVVEETKVNLMDRFLDKLNIRKMEAGVLNEGILATEVEKFVTDYEGIVVDTIAPEDILFPAYVSDSTNVDQFPFIAHRLRFTEHDLRMRKDDGTFDAEVVDSILESKTTDHLDTDTITQRDNRQQAHGILDDERTRRSFYEIYECYITCDIDGSGYDSKVIIWYSRTYNKILRWTYLNRVNKTGLLPFVKVDLFRKPRETYAVGIPELAYPVNEEVDRIHNQRLDFGTISTIPTGFYRPFSGLSNEVIKLEPGKMIPTDNPSDVNILKFGNNSQIGFNEETLATSYLEKMTNVNDLMSGRIPTPVGSTRTATGTTALLQQSGIQLDHILNRFQRGYRELLLKILVLLQEKLPVGTKFRVLGSHGEHLVDDQGKPIFDKIESRDSITGKFDFRFLANTANSNREMEKQNSILLSQLLLNPIFLKFGTVSAENVYEIAKNVLEKGGYFNISRFITEPKRVAKPLTLSEEISKIIQGEKPIIVMNDNHQDKIVGLTTYMESHEYQAGLNIHHNVSENSIELFINAINDHKTMDEIISAQAQTGNVTGLQIAPTLGAKMSGQVDPGSEQAIVNQSMQQPGNNILPEQQQNNNNQ